MSFATPSMTDLSSKSGSNHPQCSSSATGEAPQLARGHVTTDPIFNVDQTIIPGLPPPLQTHVKSLWQDAYFDTNLE